MIKFLTRIMLMAVLVFPFTAWAASEGKVAVASQDISGPLQLSPEQFPIGLQIELTTGATLTYSVQYTFDKASDHATAAAYETDAPWFTMTEINGIVDTEKAWNIFIPVRAIRLNVTAYTDGTATMTFIGK